MPSHEVQIKDFHKPVINILMELRDTTIYGNTNPIRFGFFNKTEFSDNSLNYLASPIDVKAFLFNFFQNKLLYVNHATHLKRSKYVGDKDLHEVINQFNSAISQHCLNNQKSFANLMKVHRTVLNLVLEHLHFYASVSTNFSHQLIDEYLKNIKKGHTQQILHNTPALYNSKLLNSLKQYQTLVQNCKSFTENESSKSKLEFTVLLISIIKYVSEKLDLKINGTICDFSLITLSELKRTDAFNPINELQKRKFLWMDRGYLYTDIYDCFEKILHTINSHHESQNTHFSKLNYEIAGSYSLILHGLNLLNTTECINAHNELTLFWEHIADNLYKDKFNSKPMFNLLKMLTPSPKGVCA